MQIFKISIALASFQTNFLGIFFYFLKLIYAWNSILLYLYAFSYFLIQKHKKFAIRS